MRCATASHTSSGENPLQVTRASEYRSVCPPYGGQTTTQTAPYGIKSVPSWRTLQKGNRVKRVLSTASAIAVVMVLGSGALAFAQEPDPDDAIVVLEQVAAATPGNEADVLSNVADITTEGRGDNVIEATLNDVDVVVPVQPEDGVTLGETVISLPASEAADILANGVVEYDALDNTSLVVVVKDDSSVQMTSIIESADSPTTFSYDVDLPEGAVLTPQEDGSVIATNADGTMAIGVAPAWAYDAEGRPVPTRYVVEGATLTQVVDHAGAEFTYPVVADPYWGQALFRSVTTRQAANTISAVTTDFARKLQKGTGPGIPAGNVVAGQNVLRNEGWAELKSKTWIINSKATWKQQYDCHVLGAFTPNTGGPSWDLEGNRSNNDFWLVNVWNHKCNW